MWKDTNPNVSAEIIHLLTTTSWAWCTPCSSILINMSCSHTTSRIKIMKVSQQFLVQLLFMVRVLLVRDELYHSFFRWKQLPDVEIRLLPSRLRLCSYRAHGVIHSCGMTKITLIIIDCPTRNWLNPD